MGVPIQALLKDGATSKTNHHTSPSPFCKEKLRENIYPHENVEGSTF